MIPRTIATWQLKSWQEELGSLVTRVEELFEILRLDPALLPAAQRAATLFPLRVTRSYLARITPGRPDDPLLRQILPLDDECENATAYVKDPLDETRFNPQPGLIHKYHGRVLLIASGHCAINCRYCFRRHFDYEHNTLSRREWQQSLDYLRQRDDIEEVILSGGDPLAITDKHLAWLVESLDAIPHVQRLRIHTRLPVVAPSRLTHDLFRLLNHTRLQPVIVIHCNHPQELDAQVQNVLSQMRSQGIVTLNQSVLLRGVNDDPIVLAALSKKLFAAGVLPYYLHLLDKVQGAAHFYVDESRALSINSALLATLPGYLVPKIVKEVPNAPSKVALN